MNAIEEIRAFSETAEGKEWFMSTLASAQRYTDLAQKSRKNTTKADLEREWTQRDAALSALKESKIPALMVSKSSLEDVVGWNRAYSDPARDGRYVLRVVHQNGRYTLRPTHQAARESFHNSQTVSASVEELLSGKITRVSTRTDRDRDFRISWID